MLESLKKAVYEANMELPRRNLVTYTWGNVSGIDREKGLFVIKPSGVEYDELKPEDLVVVDLKGNKVEFIDQNTGCANLMHFVNAAGTDVLVATNREIDEVAMYTITE